MKLNIKTESAYTGSSSCSLLQKQQCFTGIAKQPTTSPATQQKQCRPTFEMMYSELAMFMPAHVMAEVTRLKASGQGPKIVKLVGKHNFVRAMSVASRRGAEPCRQQQSLASAAASASEITAAVGSTPQPAACNSPTAPEQLTEAQKKGLFDQFRVRNKAEQSALWKELSLSEREFLQQAVETHAALNRFSTPALEELSRLALGELCCKDTADAEAGM